VTFLVLGTLGLIAGLTLITNNLTWGWAILVSSEVGLWGFPSWSRFDQKAGWAFLRLATILPYFQNSPQY